MRFRACCCSGSKLSSDSTPLPKLNRTISSNLLLMALPFIVGPHQCSLTQGPEGRPQVEVVLRIRMLSSSRLRNSTRCFSKQGLSQPRLLQPRSKQVFRQWDTEAPLRRRKPRLNGKRLVVLTQKSRRILLGMIHQLILPMKSCLLCSRMLHDSRILVKEGPPLL